MVSLQGWYDNEFGYSRRLLTPSRGCRSEYFEVHSRAATDIAMVVLNRSRRVSLLAVLLRSRSGETMVKGNMRLSGVMKS